MSMAAGFVLVGNSTARNVGQFSQTGTRLSRSGVFHMNPKTALIIGAGPAGLTAAYELLEKTDIKPIIFEKSEYMGGIARTVNYKGNRIDIGGHRFFSKSERVMQWWLNIMPMQASDGKHQQLGYQNRRRDIATSTAGPDPDHEDVVMLIRQRKSRIYFLRQFFDYPLKLSIDTLAKLGLWRTLRIGASYLQSVVHQIKPEKNLEQFFINRFGRELYRTFFKSYTEKVWGIECRQISAEWGAQRIKGLSILKTLQHALGKLLPKRDTDVAQKEVETSLIERFLYPKLGPGQLWEEVARLVTERGGQIITHANVRRLLVDGNAITSLEIEHTDTGEVRDYEGDYVFSTMPVQELIRGLQTQVPENVREVSEGLIYRDFITVGLLVEELEVCDETPAGKQLIKDNWIYIQEPEALVGRLQIFNNWSPYMVADRSKVWLGLEYFCFETDPLWKMRNEELIDLARQELSQMGIIKVSSVLDATVLRMPKTYPAYFGTYDRFPELRDFVDQFENLFLIGRNGMHRYNNQDHSMLTAMVAVDNIASGITDKANLWEVNTEQEYHEQRQREPTVTTPSRVPVMQAVGKATS